MNQRRAFLLKGVSAGSAIAAAKIAGPIAAASALPPTHAHGGTTLFVSPQGRDTNDGTTAHQQAELHGPLATLTAALRRLTGMVIYPGQPRRIVLCPGIHTLSEPLKLGPRHGGTAESPVIFSSLNPDQPAIISGGRQISQWRVNEAGNWIAHLPEVAAGRWQFSQLFADGQRRYRPRLPLRGFYKIAHQIPASKPGGGDDQLGFAPGEFSPHWHNLADVEVLCFLEWFAPRMRISALDMHRNIVRFVSPVGRPAAWCRLRRGKHFIIENVREALGEPGQWYLDRRSGELTYLPLPGENPDHTIITAPVLPYLLKLENTGHISFENIQFQFTNWNCPPAGYHSGQSEIMLGGAIRATNAHHCTFDACGVSHVGEYGIALGAGCRHNRIRNSCLYDLGAGGIKIGGTKQPPAAPLARYNTVFNTLISSGGRKHPGAMGIWIGIAADNLLRHNEIRDLYQTGISLGWTWGYQKTAATGNRVLHNYIHRIGQRITSDMGGIYMLGVSPNTIIEGNVIKHVSDNSYGGWGIYFDEGASYIVARNNLTMFTQSAGLHLHYGRDNVVENNIFAFGAVHQMRRSRFEKHLQMTLRHNIFLANQHASAELLHIIRPAGQPLEAYLKFDHNLYWNLAGTVRFLGGTFAAWQHAGEDPHSLVANPDFINPREGNFTLEGNSPALRIGFVPFNWRRAGLAAPTARQRSLAICPPAFTV